MSLISCPECGNGVSDRADHCPHCARPLARKPSMLWLAGGFVVLTIGAFIAYWRIRMAITLNVDPALSGDGVSFGLAVAALGLMIMLLPIIRWIRHR